MIPGEAPNIPIADNVVQPPVSQSLEEQMQVAANSQELSDQAPIQTVQQGGTSSPAGMAVTQFQRVQASAAQAFRPLTDTVWSKLDRKATAIAEFTLRQYRTKTSTWVVLGIASEAAGIAV